MTSAWTEPDAAPQAAARLRTARDEAERRVCDLRRELDGVLASASSTTGDDEHDPEGATIGFERAQAQALLERARVRVTALDAALGRMSDGTYGRCAVCDAAIDAERLAARPATDRCRAHA